MRVVGRALVAGAVTLLAVTLGSGAWLTPAPEAPASPRRAPDVHERREAQPRKPKPPAPASPPSMVLVLLDDLSLDLVPTMHQVQRMQEQGASYEHSYVVDSLCCVSRSSLLTGQYPHQTGVRTNTANTPNLIGPLGGWEAFAAYGNLERSVNVRLQRAGWTTGFIGKYLNQYEPVADLVVPPGWSNWQAIFGDAYDGWDFHVTRQDGDDLLVDHIPAPPAEASDEEKDAAYVGTVVADRAVDFIREHRGERSPYFLMVAPYGTHSRVGPVGHYPDDPAFPPAFRDRPAPDRPGNCGAVACTSLGIDDLPGFGDVQDDNAPRYADGSPAPQWRDHVPAITVAGAEDTLRNRARMAQSLDWMLGRIRAAVGPDTYVVLTSDNGFHIGQHGLDQGKGTPFESDVRVPLVVTGPGVEPGPRGELVSNLDLAPTLEDLAGLRPAAYRSGTSLVPTLGDRARDRRRFTFFEHTWAPSLGADPDALYAGGTTDLVPSYAAVRSRTGLLVRFDLDHTWDGVEHVWEFYDYTAVGWERRNTYGDPRHRAEIAQLTRRLERFGRCAEEISGDDAVPDRCRSLTH